MIIGRVEGGQKNYFSSVPTLILVLVKYVFLPALLSCMCELPMSRRGGIGASARKEKIETMNNRIAGI